MNQTTDIKERVLSHTESVCPVCLRRISADRVLIDEDIYLIKECPEHGGFKTVIWRGTPKFGQWDRQNEHTPPKAVLTQTVSGCPFDCGICPGHKQQACCVLIEVTSDCDQHCPFCFADARGNEGAPALEEIIAWLKTLKDMSEQRPYNIQLSGGEPAVRDDLAQIIRAARSIGFPYIQLNTNGNRLSYDRDYLDGLVEAGLSAVFLQFDGTEDGIYEKLRGCKLLGTKKKAIENCAGRGIGVVLVPTLVPGVNTHNIGDIIRFAMDNLPTVRGVHFQPVSYFGRFPEPPEDRDRITLPEVVSEIESQTDGKIAAGALRPLKSGCALCSFKGSFVLTEGGSVISVSDEEGCCCRDKPSIEKARDFLVNKWVIKQTEAQRDDGQAEGLDMYIKRIRDYGFSITGMAFQDAWSIDLKRLQACSVHVYDGRRKKLVPFCAYNLTNRDGRSLYRGNRD